MSRHRGGGALALFGLLLLSTLCLSMPTTAQDISPGVMQAEDPRNLTYDQNRMFMYGSNDDGGRQDSWPMWTHSATSDTESDDSLGEANAQGDENNGGGPRTFTWTGTNPRDEAVQIDKAVMIEGRVKLSIICNVEQNQCSKQLDIILRLGQRDISQVSIPEPDADGYYAFSFDHRQEEIPAGETFGLRISFQKPHSLTDGYTLYLGPGNSEMTIPVLPPYQETVPGLDNPDGYISPYADAKGYAVHAANTTSWFGLVFWSLASIGVFVGGFTLLPPIPFKEITILLTGLGLLVSMMVAPAIAGPMAVSMAADPDDPDIWTPSELAQLEEREGTFLGDALVEDYAFKYYVEYDELYISKHEGVVISALGFEDDADILGDSEISRRGREYVQLFFSAFHADLRPGQAVLVDVKIVNVSDPNTGELVFLPDFAVAEDQQIIPVEVNGELSVRFTIPHEACTLIGEDSTWSHYPLIVMTVGFLMGGIGGWMYWRENRAAYDEDEDWEEEDWEEEVLDDLEDL